MERAEVERRAIEATLAMARAWIERERPSGLASHVRAAATLAAVESGLAAARDAGLSGHAVDLATAAVRLAVAVLVRLDEEAGADRPGQYL
ncbi:MAG: hypothetical protein QN130_12320 [Armatimonadota bacterium]|nr:hypothetical protein [Armatimonadota bacterium]